MKNYLETSGPWSQLLKFNNVDFKPMQHDSMVSLNNNLKNISTASAEPLTL